MSILDLGAEWAENIPTGKGETFYFKDIPLGHILQPNVVWLNGDIRRGMTRRQDVLRAAVKVCGAVAVIVPLRALESAGVEYVTIEPVDVHPEEFTYTPRSSDEPPKMVPLFTPAMVEVGGFLLSWHLARWGPQAIEYVSEGHDVAGTIIREDSSQAVRLIDGRYHWHDARHWLGDCVFTAERNGRREYFVSSFDRQETPPLYFLSQLPGPAETVDQAIELLAPESVKTARELGREVVRQGDMFAIPMDVSTRELRGGVLHKRRAEGSLRHSDGSLYGTAHTATEVTTMPDGRQFARGMLYHDPKIIGEARRPDHRRRKLGRQWHLITRNTVPVIPNLRTVATTTGKGE